MPERAFTARFAHSPRSPRAAARVFRPVLSECFERMLQRCRSDERMVPESALRLLLAEHSDVIGVLSVSTMKFAGNFGSSRGIGGSSRSALVVTALGLLGLLGVVVACRAKASDLGSPTIEISETGFKVNGGPETRLPVEYAEQPKSIEWLDVELTRSVSEWKRVHPDRALPPPVLSVKDTVKMGYVASVAMTIQKVGYTTVAMRIGTELREVKLGQPCGHVQDQSSDDATLYVAALATGYRFTWMGGRSLIVSFATDTLSTPSAGTAPFASLIQQQWEYRGVHNVSSDLNRDSSVVVYKLNAPFSTVASAIDGVLAPQRSVDVDAGTEKVSAFWAWLYLPLQKGDPCALPPTGNGDLSRIDQDPYLDRGTVLRMVQDGKGTIFPSAKVEVGPATVHGGLTSEQIAQSVTQIRHQFQQCYLVGLGRDEKLAGRLEVRVTIQPDGRVSSAASVGSSLQNDSIVQCVLDANRTLSFPNPESRPMTVEYPLTFTSY